MNTSDKQQLISITLDLNNLLTQYINIHNSFLDAKFNIPYVLPILSPLRLIYYKDWHERAGKTLDELNCLNSQVVDIENRTVNGKNEYIATLKEYISRLSKTIEILIDVLYKLYRKSLGDNSYSYIQYKKDLEDYKSLVQNHLSYRDMLNIKFNEFRGSAN